MLCFSRYYTTTSAHTQKCYPACWHFQLHHSWSLYSVNKIVFILDWLCSMFMWGHFKSVISVCDSSSVRMTRMILNWAKGYLGTATYTTDCDHKNTVTLIGCDEKCSEEFTKTDSSHNWDDSVLDSKQSDLTFNYDFTWIFWLGISSLRLNANIIKLKYYASNEPFPDSSQSFCANEKSYF